MLSQLIDLEAKKKKVGSAHLSLLLVQVINLRHFPYMPDGPAVTARCLP
jgi:hypothetical protein